MSGTKGGLQIVAVPADGWCDPDAGVCHINTDDDAATAEAGNENFAGAVPDATERGAPPAVSLPTR